MISIVLNSSAQSESVMKATLTIMYPSTNSSVSFDDDLSAPLNDCPMSHCVPSQFLKHSFYVAVAELLPSRNEQKLLSTTKFWERLCSNTGAYHSVRCLVYVLICLFPDISIFATLLYITTACEQYLQRKHRFVNICIQTYKFSLEVCQCDTV